MSYRGKIAMFLCAICALFLWTVAIWDPEGAEPRGDSHASARNEERRTPPKNAPEPSAGTPASELEPQPHSQQPKSLSAALDHSGNPLGSFTPVEDALADADSLQDAYRAASTAQTPEQIRAARLAQMRTRAAAYDALLADAEEDVEWQERFTKRLGFAFDQFDGAASVEDARCGSSICRLRIRPRDRTAYAALLGYSSAARTLLGAAGMLIPADDEDGEEITLYVARPGEELPDPAASSADSPL
ncbi:MAG: hypothetical protein OEZ06_31040 [Myxococcales bacterium]|nr:hypothetical protein [Myxococcales bacterium]